MYPCDVELILRRFPGVVDAAVVGVANPNYGELVKAVLVMKSDARFDRRTFEAYCKDNLAAHKRPKIVEVQTDDLPRNFLGKVLRRQLREPAPTNPPPATSTSHASPTQRHEDALVAALRE